MTSGFSGWKPYKKRHPADISLEVEVDYLLNGLDPFQDYCFSTGFLESTHPGDSNLYRDFCNRDFLPNNFYTIFFFGGGKEGK